MTENPGIREMIHQTMQATSAGDEDIDGAVLVGWVVVSEWVAPDGSRWLSRCSGNGSGSGRDLPAWQEQGYLHYALHGARQPPG
jgi:hypothetical protein